MRVRNEHLVSMSGTKVLAELQDRRIQICVALVASCLCQRLKSFRDLPLNIGLEFDFCKHFCMLLRNSVLIGHTFGLCNFVPGAAWCAHSKRKSYFSLEI